jgi:hypothetical protein
MPQSAAGGQPELGKPLKGVFQGPGGGDLVVVDPVDVDLGDVGEAAAGGFMAEPDSGVGGGT